jgi:hypothetical protein
MLCGLALKTCKLNFFFSSGQNTKWNCTFSGYYRGQTANIASYSEDGSLLCVGFGPVLTIWDPDTNVLLQTLANHKDKSDIK